MQDRKKQKEQLYEAYNLLHSLAQVLEILVQYRASSLLCSNCAERAPRDVNMV
jgi:hypothetical protein